MDDLRKEIEKMLDNTILDWNRVSQLTTVNSKENYDKLIPAIEELIKRKQLEALDTAINKCDYFCDSCYEELREALEKNNG